MLLTISYIGGRGAVFVTCAYVYTPPCLTISLSSLFLSLSLVGEQLRDQVEERLKFYDTGDAPRKNVDVMSAVAESLRKIATKTEKVSKKSKKSIGGDEKGGDDEKKEKKDKKRSKEVADTAEEVVEEDEGKKKKKKKVRLNFQFDEVLLSDSICVKLTLLLTLIFLYTSFYSLSLRNLWAVRKLQRSMAKNP